MKVGLRARERLYRDGNLHVERETTAYAIKLGVAGIAEGESVPFRFRIPRDVEPEVPYAPRPGRQPPLVELRWELEVEAHGCVVRVPFRVLPASDRPADAPSRIAPPTIGSDRLRALWESAGAEHGLRYDAQRLTGSVGETQVVVRREHRGRDGVFLVAELSYPDLGVELRVERAGLVDRLVGKGISIGDPVWDGAHSVKARDATQVLEILRSIAHATTHAEVRTMGDERLVLGWRDAGQSHQKLAAFVGATVALARVVDAARRSLPPPQAMRPALEGWRGLARAIGGTLETGRMRVSGALGGVGVSVSTEYDREGAPAGTILSADPSAALDEAHRWTWTPAHGETAIEARFKGEAREIVGLVVQSAAELRIEPARISIHVPAPLGVAQAGVSVTPEQALQRLERLARLGTLLRSHAGPYR